MSVKDSNAFLVQFHSDAGLFVNMIANEELIEVYENHQQWRFGIQEIGLMIEEPFSRSLQLEVIAQTINADVIETVNADVFRSFSKNREARENT